jgi:membrane protease YdiL (CAAX protease family)
VVESEGRRLRNGWWIATFLAILALLLFPTILMAAHFKREVTIAEQALIIALATVAIQTLRRKPLAQVIGRLDRRWLIEFLLGGLSGGLLMIVPALVLAIAGLVRFDLSHTSLDALLDAALFMAGVALAEELLFRGVLFQRLIAGLGVWPAQVLIARLFVPHPLEQSGNAGRDQDLGRLQHLPGFDPIWLGLRTNAEPGHADRPAFHGQYRARRRSWLRRER